MREQMRLTPEKTRVTHVDDGFDLLGFRIVRRPWKQTKRVAYTFPKPASAAHGHASHQDADQSQHGEPLA